MTLQTRKKSHRLRTTIIIVMIVIGAAVAFFYITNRQRQEIISPVIQPQKVAISDEAAADVKYGLPERLLIPKLKVDTTIMNMGLTANGEMDVPADLVNVGWYKFGTKPGEKGSAVIAGHLEGVEDLGVFIDLDKLRSGDIINVRNDRDELISFAVRESRTYKQDERPNEIFNRTDGSYLNLITCTGTWNKEQKRYSHRLVVFADKVEK